MKKIYKFELNMLTMNILCIVMFILSYYILFMCGYKGEMSGYWSIIIMLGYLALHEIMHGIGYLLFAKNKKNIKFGAVLEKGALYAMCQEEISKKAIIISLLFPLVTLTFVTLPLALIFNNHFLVFLSLINFSGAIGDIMMFLLIVKMPRDISYIDYNNDLGCFIVSKNDLSNYKMIGIKLTKVMTENEIKVDSSIKRIYISVSSYVIIAIFIAIDVLRLITEVL